MFKFLHTGSAIFEEHKFLGHSKENKQDVKKA